MILQQSDSAQTVKFIPRDKTCIDGNVYFVDNQTNVTYSYPVTLMCDRYYSYFTKVLADLKEEHLYTMIVTSGNVDADEIYRTQVFVTNQSEYSINNSQFIERTTNNDYLVVE